MGATEPGSAREEAERLVATLLATARLASAGGGPGAGPWGPLGGIVSGVLGHSAGASRSTGGNHRAEGFATGSPECCICPICRAVAALRDPSPEFAERLATGAGDLAAGVASLMRAFGPPGAGEATPGASGDAAAPTGPSNSGADHVWREATRTGHDSASAPERDVWSAATRAEDAVEPAAAAPPVDDAGPAAPAQQVRPVADGPVVPTSRAPAGADGDAPGDGA
ncbi:hypothetical protein [Micromonospora sp. HUAS LYJ1]|uniref:hypothetical protein n=1 Tax=Micromonospora sp. HUAS LYJ1 TaxID=3061626 RepID=UPI0026710CBE|nr:hypothetical protein [Micromonospora sp. HUAS LYJ1]WKU07613.1 hypothetical protein Q2K16_11510 [Micromonospora sp. HUAS LYJ1]